MKTPVVFISILVVGYGIALFTANMIVLAVR